MAQLVIGMKLAQGDGISKKLTLGYPMAKTSFPKGIRRSCLQLRRYENLLARAKFAPASYKVPSNQRSFQQNITSTISSNLNDSNNTISTTSIVSDDLNEATIQEELLIDPTLFDEPEDVTTSLLNLGLQNYKSAKFVDTKFYFEKAAKANNPVALRHLGILFFLGQGVSIDYQKANRYFEMAKRFRRFGFS